MEEIVPFIIAFVVGYMVRALFSKAAAAADYLSAMKELELKFLLLVSNYIQWREQALTALKISYKFIEIEKPEDKEKNDEILKKVEEKYNEIIEEYIKEINKVLPYKTDYINYETAIRYINRHIKK